MKSDVDNLSFAKKIVIVGAGGHCHVVVDACHAGLWDIVGILDPLLPVGTRVASTFVIGGDDCAQTLIEQGIMRMAIAIGSDLLLRKKLSECFSKMGFVFPTLSNNPTFVSKNAELAEGIVLLPGCIVNSDTKIGAQTILNSSCVIEHEVQVGAYSHIAPHAVLLGASSVGSQTLIGAQAVILPGVAIGDRCIVGAGSVVTKDVADGCTVVGSPSRIIKRDKD